MFAVLTAVRKSLGAVFLSLFAALFLAACQPGVTTGGGPSINTNAPVPVALLVPGDSAQAGDAILAQALENATRMAIADLDGVKIDLRVYNTGGEAARAAAAATRAVDEGAKIILGPVYAASANAAGVAVAPRGVNVLAFSTNTDIAGGNVFLLGPTFENTAQRLMSYAAARGKGRVMVVRGDNQAGQVGTDAVNRAAARSGAQVVAEAAYEFSQNGVVQAVPTIVSTAQQTQAQSLIFTANSGGALPLLAQLLPENGAGPQTFQYIGLTRWDIPPATLSFPGLQGGWFALPDPVLSQNFQIRYQAAFGAAPHPIAGLAYDGIAAIGALVSQGRSDALSAVALTQRSGFAGVNGVFRLNPDGTNDRGLAIAEIRDAQVVVIDPAPRSFAGAGL